VAGELIELEPPAFAAVTLTRIVWFTSPAVSRYVEEVAPSMLAQLLPEELQSRHW
jgi:hypothetical protein